MTNTETNDTAAIAAAQGAPVAPEKTSSKKAAKRTKGAPKGEKTASAQRRKRAKTGKQVARRATGRTQSKGRQEARGEDRVPEE